MRKLLLTSVAVALISFSQADANSGLKLGAVNVLSRNVTRWTNITEEVSIDKFIYTYCSDKQCRKKSGTSTESQKFSIATVETELYCRPGFYQTGESCEDDCAETKIAQGVCSPELDKCCQNGGICLKTNNDITCNCSDGWTGDYCSERCPVNFYGPRCSLECPACSNGGTCDPVTGKCDCSPGWTGPTCDEKCSSGWYGKDCALDCRSCISDDGQCHHITGECECGPPYGGPFCAETCHDGGNVQCGWFPDCCRNGATCVQTGRESRCDCPPGYKGKFCEKTCKDSWGYKCLRTCLCNNGTCDPVTGECECTPGWFGKYCKERFKPTTDSLKCPVNCSEEYGCDQDGRCMCPSNSTWNEDTSSCLGIPPDIRTSTSAKNNVNLSDGKVAESNRPSSPDEPLSKVSISLIAVCGVLAVFVIVALVLSVKNREEDVKPWIVSINEDNERRESRSRRMLSAAPKMEDNAYFFHARSKTGGNDGVFDGNIQANRQTENEDATYSVVNDDLKAACRLLPSLSETPQEPPCPTDIYDPFQEVSLSPEGLMRPRIGSTPSYRFAGGFQRQNSTVSTYEGSIRPFSRSTSVVSRTESFYEDMNKTSRSSSMCRPMEL